MWRARNRSRRRTKKRIGITRAHLEEDAGKSVHDVFADDTGIDLNRAGVPLLEIVSEPDLRSADEATAYMRAIHTLVRYLRICDGNMEEGSFRCDANVSVRRVGETRLGTRTEIKNLNSFRFVGRAINYEIDRQIELLTNGGEVVQETRLYDAATDETRPMRGKEEANDYRYFPRPRPPAHRPDRRVHRTNSARASRTSVRKARKIPGPNTHSVTSTLGASPPAARLPTTTRRSPPHPGSPDSPPTGWSVTSPRRCTATS